MQAPITSRPAWVLGSSSGLVQTLSRTRLSWCLVALAGLAMWAPRVAQATDSVCFGRTSNGRLEGGVRLPADGPNFRAYSSLAAAAGRTYVHARVAQVVEASYAALAQALPNTVFVYGETGWRQGGRFRPHKTHQNGLSVDFFVPVLNAAGQSVPIPTSPTTKFGYELEFNAAAQLGELRIDFAALAEHLYRLDVAAKRHGAPIALVIFDTAYLDRLFATPRGPQIRGLPFMKGKPWVRHDEHIHVDFSVPCRAMSP